MSKRSLLLTFFLVCGLFVFSNAAHAGFGISPPYVKSERPLVPGSHYEQEIALLRSSADEDLQAIIMVNAPEISSWIRINKGDTFDLPSGELQVPMLVIVDVPKDAAVGEYKGNINVRVAPKANSGSGVSIALGARIDIDLTIAKETYLDYEIRTAQIPNFEELGTPWKWPIFSWFFYRIDLEMKLNNKGNVPAAPTKVGVDVYDLMEKQLLESKEDSTIKAVLPFTMADVKASFPTRLPAGSYWAKIRIYQDNEIIRSDKIAFSIAKPGMLDKYQKDLFPWAYVLAAVYISFVIILLLLLIKLRSWRLVFKILGILAWPFLYILKRLMRVYANLKIKFWKWMHKKSAKYQDNISNRDKNNE